MSKQDDMIVARLASTKLIVGRCPKCNGFGRIGKYLCTYCDAKGKVKVHPASCECPECWQEMEGHAKR